MLTTWKPLSTNNGYSSILGTASTGFPSLSAPICRGAVNMIQIEYKATEKK